MPVEKALVRFFSPKSDGLSLASRSKRATPATEPTNDALASSREGAAVSTGASATQSPTSSHRVSPASASVLVAVEHDDGDAACLQRESSTYLSTGFGAIAPGRPFASVKSKTLRGRPAVAPAEQPASREAHEPFDSSSSGSPRLSRSPSPESPDGPDGVSHSSSSSRTAAATQPPSSVRPTPSADATDGSFYYHTKPRLGRYTPLIAHLMRLGESGAIGVPPAQRPAAVQQLHKKLFSLNYLIGLCDEATNILSHEPTLMRVSVNVDRESLVVVGDVHGHFTDLYKSVLSQQYSQRRNVSRMDKMFLFLGDFVDRGPHSLETILLILALKVEFPHLIYLIRGNHEEKATSRVYGFLAEVQSKLGCEEGIAVWEVITSTFTALPLSTIVEVHSKAQKRRLFSFFATHGGLSPQLLEGVDSLKKIKRESYGADRDRLLGASRAPPVDANGRRLKTLTAKEEEVCKGLMWSDPTSDTGLFGPNPRGCGFVFGPTASEKFCRANGMHFIVRAHQVVMDGYLWKHDDRVLTIFSAPNYCGVNGNLGAIMLVQKDSKSTVKAEQQQATDAGDDSGKDFYRFLSFVQYDAEEYGGDGDVVVQPSMNFPQASCFL